MSHDQMLGKIAQANVKLNQNLNHSIRALSRWNTDVGKRRDCMSDQDQL